MLHCFSPEDRNKKVTVYDVMHVVVRTAPFNVKRMRSRVDRIGSSSVYNEMNCVTCVHGHTHGKAKRRVSQGKERTEADGIQGDYISSRVLSADSA